MIITKPKHHIRQFEDLTPLFNAWYKEWSPLVNNFPLKGLSDARVGRRQAISKLTTAGYAEGEDFKGIYVFLKKGKPFYTGISRTVIKRLCQHIKGRDHFSASLCYRIGIDLHKKEKGETYTGKRSLFPFDEYGRQAQRMLSGCSVAIKQIDDDLELYIFEAYVSMKLGTLNYNSFKTH